MKELIRRIVRALVDSPEEVDVQEIEAINRKILEVELSRQDLERLIGRIENQP